MFRQLRMLDYFDFWMKLDDDVRWAKRFPGDIARHLIAKRHLFFHTGACSDAGGVLSSGRERQHEPDSPLAAPRQERGSGSALASPAHV